MTVVVYQSCFIPIEKETEMNDASTKENEGNEGKLNRGKGLSWIRRGANSLCTVGNNPLRSPELEDFINI